MINKSQEFNLSIEKIKEYKKLQIAIARPSSQS